MKELKSYISEGFFSNVGANNKVKLVIDAIKDASINDKINSYSKRQKFRDLLTSILKDIEADMKKGKFVFKYTRDDGTCQNDSVTISFEKSDSNDASWNYSAGWNRNTKKGIRWTAEDIARRVTDDLYCEAEYPLRDSKLRHSIANTIKVTEFKIS